MPVLLIGRGSRDVVSDWSGRGGWLVSVSMGQISPVLLAKSTAYVHLCLLSAMRPRRYLDNCSMLVLALTGSFWTNLALVEVLQTPLPNIALL